MSRPTALGAVEAVDVKANEDPFVGRTACGEISHSERKLWPVANQVDFPQLDRPMPGRDPLHQQPTSPGPKGHELALDLSADASSHVADVVNPCFHKQWSEAEVVLDGKEVIENGVVHRPIVSEVESTIFGMELPYDFPTTELDFEQTFADEDACRRYLMRLRWPEGFTCPKCETAKGWAVAGRDLVECASCSRQTSLTAGTVLHGTRKPLKLWFRAMFLMVSQKVGVSAKNFQRMMGLKSYGTAWTWLHKLRRAMVRSDRPKLSGLVEVDEAFIGGVAQGRVARGSLNPIVVVAVEREEKRLGRVRMQVVDDQSQATLGEFVEENVEPGSTTRTDGWPGYGQLKALGYKHRATVRHEPKNASKNLPAVHRVIALVKRWLLGVHQGAVRPHHLQEYLDEYTFRFNRRRSSHPIKLFHRLAQQLVVTPPSSYAVIAGHRPQPVGST